MLRLYETMYVFEWKSHHEKTINHDVFLFQECYSTSNRIQIQVFADLVEDLLVSGFDAKRDLIGSSSFQFPYQPRRDFIGTETVRKLDVEFKIKSDNCIADLLCTIDIKIEVIVDDEKLVHVEFIMNKSNFFNYIFDGSISQFITVHCFRAIDATVRTPSSCHQRVEIPATGCKK